MNTNPFRIALLGAMFAAAAAPESSASLAITNGNFEVDFIQTSNVSDWFDSQSANAANWWESAWAGPTVSPNGTPVLGLSYNLATSHWAYQSIGTNTDSLDSLEIRFDAGSFTDAGADRELGVRVSIYQSDGSFVPGDGVDIATAAGVTLIDSFSWAQIVASGAVVTGIEASLDLTGASSDGELFLHLTNFAGAVGQPWTAVDNVAIVGNAPAFLSQPMDVFGVVGTDITLNSSAAANPAPTYQWEYSEDGFDPWVELEGETGASLVISGAAYADNGYYRVVATNANGSVVSDEVLVDLVYPAPVIDSQPEGGAVQVGSDVSFTVSATGLGSLSYQWFGQNSGLLSDGSGVSGATTATLSLSGVGLDNADAYFCEVTDSAASDDGGFEADAFSSSDFAVLEVFELPESDLLSFEPFLSYPEGIRLTGQDPEIAGYVGAWNNVAFGEAVPATSAGSLMLADGNYSAGLGGKVGKAADTGDITAANSGRIERLLAAELKGSALSSRTLYLSWLFRTGNEGTAPNANNYQTLGLWNGVSGDDTLRVFEAGIALTDFGTANYAFRINNSAESIADLGVAADAETHLFVARFDLTASAAGDTVTVWIDPDLSGGEPTGGSVISGVDLAFDRIAISDYAGNSSAWDEIRWGTTLESVTGEQPSIPLVPEFTLQPKDYFGAVGDTVTLSAVANSDPSPEYRWEYSEDGFDPWATIDGATESAFTLNPAAFADIGYYRVVASNLNGEVTSDEVLVDLVYPAPVITAQSASTAALAGTDVTLSVTATGLGTLSYQWFRFDLEGDVELEGETGSTLLLPSVGPDSEGDYYVVVQDDAGVADEGFPTEAVSAAATVVVTDVMITSSTAAPSIDSADQYYLPGNVDDVDNIGGRPGGVAIAQSGDNDASTYVAFDRSSQGMTFTTGSDPLGYTLDSVTVRMASWTTFLASGTFYDLQFGDTFEFQFGTLSGTVKTPIFDSDSVLYGGESLAGGADNGVGRYLTFDLRAAGIGTLAPSTTYYFEIATETGDSYFELSGTSLDGYSGGTAFRGETVAAIDANFVELAGDRAFHANLTGLSGPGEDFDAWIAMFPAVGSLNGFDDDPDGDGLVNGVESYFGTDPGVANSGVTATVAGEGTFTFRHPRNPAAPSDVSATYRWSTDLATWNGGGETSNGTTVQFSSSHDTPEPGTTTVTATATGTVPPSLFVEVRVIRTP